MVEIRRFVGGGAAVLFIALGVFGVAAEAGPLDTPGYTKVFTCSACHGMNGNSRSDTMPILAAQHADYLKKALEDYAAGRRPSPEMEPYGKMAVHLGADDVARYFAAQKREKPSTRVDSSAAARGQAAATKCANCHGANGKGDVAKRIPDLTGQPVMYLQRQMLLFKADQRSPKDDALREMKALMKDIPDAMFADLAAYYSSLR